MDGFYLVKDDSTSNEYLTSDSGLTESVIGPGRVWLVECDAAGLSPVHAGLLRHVNVVLYERALGAALAETLPTGLYAEPLPATAGPSIAPRARQFAAEGWSVVQLIKRRADREEQPQSAIEYLDRSDRRVWQAPDALASGLIFTANGLAG